jgi:hypothetical protein
MLRVPSCLNVTHAARSSNRFGCAATAIQSASAPLCANAPLGTVAIPSCAHALGCSRLPLLQSTESIQHTRVHLLKN